MNAGKLCVGMLLATLSTMCAAFAQQLPANVELAKYSATVSRDAFAVTEGLYLTVKAGTTASKTTAENFGSLFYPGYATPNEVLNLISAGDALVGQAATRSFPAVGFPFSWSPLQWQTDTGIDFNEQTIILGDPIGEDLYVCGNLGSWSHVAETLYSNDALNACNVQNWSLAIAMYDRAAAHFDVSAECLTEARLKLEAADEAYIASMGMWETTYGPPLGGGGGGGTPPPPGP